MKQLLADTPPEPTHEMSYLLQIGKKQHFLILKSLKEEAEEVVVQIDEILASHLYGVNDVELRKEE